MNQGFKLLLASLSVTATMSGWAWLTATQMATPSAPDPTDPVPTDAPTSVTVMATDIPVPVIADAVNTPPPTYSIPNLADLPVRGLPVAGATRSIQAAAVYLPSYTPVPGATYAPPPTDQPQNHNGGGGGGGGGGGSAVNPPPKQPGPPPPPPPKPTRVRKGKPSHP